MKLGAGVVFVAIGLAVLWAATTGRLSKFIDLWGKASGDGSGAANMSNPGDAGATRAQTLADALGVPRNFPALPTLPSLN